MSQEILLTTNQMTSLFQITRQGFSRWVERGMPKKGRNQFSLKDCLEWVKRNVWFVGVGKQDMAEEKLKFQRARSEREVLRAEKEKGLLIERGTADQIYWGLLSEVRLGMCGLPRRLAEILAAEGDAKIVEELLRNSIYEVLERVSQPVQKLPKCYHEKPKKKKRNRRARA